VKILLDACEFLYLISGDPKLSSRALSAILDPQNSVFLSAVSFWEISVKHGLGKLVIPEPPSEFVTKQRKLHRIESLSLDELSVAQLPGLPAIHRDPFDRMLICQALAHGLTLASSDPLIHQYPVTIL
jgi:PIN domain nuclease of toxin-antitoxin system